MEYNQDINNRLDELFAKARTDKPVMGVDEVRNLIATAPVTSTPAKTNTPSKSNFSLYLILGGLAIFAVTAGIWYYLESDNQQVSENKATSNTTISNEISPAVSSTPQENTGSEMVAAENGEKSEVTEENDASELKNTVGDNTSDAAKSGIVKPSKDESKSEEPAVPASSGNKTYLVTGGDFVVNFQTDDKTVKLKLAEDEVKELNINGKAISASDYPKYKDLIDRGKKMMEAERLKNTTTASSTKTPEEQKRDDLNTRLFNAFTEQLKKDKLINEDKYSFKLTSSELLIDGKAQPDAVRQKYIDLFRSVTNRDLGGTTFKFDHGMN